MRIIARSALFASGLLLAAVSANAQTYYQGYSYPGYTAYPGATYPYPYYYNHVYPGYASSPYYSYYYQRPTAYNDPYVAARPYSDGAGPRVSGHVGY